MKEGVMKVVFLLAACMSILAVALICIFLFANGVPAIHKIGITEFLFGQTWKPSNNIYGIFPMIIGSIYVTAGAVIIGVPMGILCAIFLARFCPDKLYKIVKPAVSLLAGIPSIVYGLFGYLFFNIFLEWSYTILGGALTLAIMILPLIMRTTEEALIAVPDLYREGSFGLGAGKLRTVFRIVLPSAIPGILAGVILAVGRIVGETAALLYPAGTATKVADGLMSSGRTLAVHMYALLNEGLYMDQAYATAVVLLVVVIGINALSGLIAKKVGVKD